jgi:hypothetical protein
VIDLIDVRIPVTHLMSQSPNHEPALAAGVFYLNRRSLAPRVFDLKHHAIEQALAAKVFYLKHHVIWQSLAPDRFSSELR